MKILITGGLGRIGSHLSNILSQRNETTILDNFSNVNKEETHLSIIKGDIRDSSIFDIISKNDIIVHTAAQTSVNKSIEDPIFDSDNNINGTLNLLEASRNADIKRFIYISSAAVYGIPVYLPIDEKHPTSPISPYGLSKLTGERYATLYHDLYGLPVTCIRLFNVFGPFSSSNDSYSGVITKFIDRIKNNKNPIIFGDGNQTRDFIYINDIVNTISKIIENDKTIGEIYNIGTGNPIKIIYLAKIIIDKFDKNLEPEFFPSKIGDIQESYANIDKIRKLIEPDYSLEKGLEEIIRFIKSK